MDVKKAIAELTSQLSEVNYDSDEDNILLKDSNQILDDDDYNFNYNDKSKLRKATETVTLPEKTYGGKKISRKKINSDSESSDEPDFLDSDEERISEDDTCEKEDKNSDIEGVDESAGETGTDSNDDEDDNDEEEDTSTQQLKPLKKSNIDCNIYSAATKNVPNDVKKGIAIRNQLRIWECLLECRIKLQKGLVASNNLPAREQLLSETNSELSPDYEESVNKCKKNLLNLLGKVVDLQDELLKQSAEYKMSKEICSTEADDEIPSDDSGLENEEEEDEKVEDDQPARKKRKLDDYSTVLKQTYNNLIPYRNVSIQKWNDKTKVATGKLANSNFSAFDQSTLKQIEQIMADKSRLINRTRVKRSNDSKTNQDNSNDQDVDLDPEIFDDTDFYHKLLRDYIERKSVDVVNSSNTERQMIELQKLRSKMKKNVDTKSTKGRKLRYVVLPKLVNFMAPRPYNTWNEPAETELYNSLFGKIKTS